MSLQEVPREQTPNVPKVALLHNHSYRPIRNAPRLLLFRDQDARDDHAASRAVHKAVDTGAGRNSGDQEAKRHYEEESGGVRVHCLESLEKDYTR